MFHFQKFVIIWYHFGLVPLTFFYIVMLDERNKKKLARICGGIRQSIFYLN